MAAEWTAPLVVSTSFCFNWAEEQVSALEQNFVEALQMGVSVDIAEMDVSSKGVKQRAYIAL
jgi:hypothetical protein